MAQAEPDPSVPLLDSDLEYLKRCPLCQCGRHREFSTRAFGDFPVRHFRCEDCGLIFMSPRPTSEWYGRYYASAFWEGKATIGKRRDNLLRADNVVSRGRAEKYLSILSQSCGHRQIGSILEIGAGDGLIVYIMSQALGARAYAIEPSLKARQAASEHTKVEMVGDVADDLAYWTPDSPIDLVLFSHALENIIDIESTLVLVKRIIAPDGCVMVETPNADWHPSMSIYHPHCFSRSSLRMLGSRVGLSTAHESTSAAPSDIRLIPRYLTMIFRNGEASRTVRPIPTWRVRLQHRISRRGQKWFKINEVRNPGGERVRT